MNKNIELIDKYFEGLLQGNELKAFEERRLKDPEFKTDIENYKIAINAINSFQSIVMKSELKQIHKKLFKFNLFKFLLDCIIPILIVIIGITQISDIRHIEQKIDQKIVSNTYQKTPEANIIDNNKPVESIIKPTTTLNLSNNYQKNNLIINNDPSDTFNLTKLEIPKINVICSDNNKTQYINTSNIKVNNTYYESEKTDTTIEIFVFIPNAFSPNGKGPTDNEYFKVSVTNIKEFELFIYDIYDELIYYSNNYESHGWNGNKYNGELKPEGYYICLLTIIDTNNKVCNYKKIIKLIR